MEAARDGIELTDLTVTVDSETDFRGILGVDDTIHPGPLAVRVRIQLGAADATEDQLREIVQRAESRSPVRDALERAVSMTTEIVPAWPQIVGLVSASTASEHLKPGAPSARFGRQASVMARPLEMLVVDESESGAIAR
jgi:hypothetical protein